MILVANWSLAFWAWILIFIGILLVGLILGFLIARKVTQNYLEKNPPINEKMIKAMYQQMGRTPSEKQIRQVMAAVKQNK